MLSTGDIATVVGAVMISSFDSISMVSIRLSLLLLLLLLLSHYDHIAPVAAVGYYSCCKLPQLGFGCCWFHRLSQHTSPAY
jgi:hypothetical protein